MLGCRVYNLVRIYTGHILMGNTTRNLGTPQVVTRPSADDIIKEDFHVIEQVGQPLKAA